MKTRSLGRSLLPGLMPALLAACVSTEPAIANPPSPALGVDLGGAPARRASAVELATATVAAPIAGVDHSSHGAGAVQLAHDGHAGAHGTGTVTAVNVAQRKIGMQHEPIPSLGWPAMAMEFSVAPSVNLQAVRPGSRINFSLEKGADGMYMIQSLQPAGAAR